MEGFLEELSFQLSPAGGIGFELVEKMEIARQESGDQQSRMGCLVGGGQGRKFTEVLVEPGLFTYLFHLFSTLTYIPI
jgi:hypothetical protein